MKNFITPLIHITLAYALLFFYFDKTILSLCFAISQMLILPANLIWILSRSSNNRGHRYQTAGYYLAVLQISLVVVDLTMIISRYPFVIRGLGLFLLLNLIPAVFVLNSLGRKNKINNGNKNIS
jgi:hypothetical protein